MDKRLNKKDQRKKIHVENRQRRSTMSSLKKITIRENVSEIILENFSKKIKDTSIG